MTSAGQAHEDLAGATPSGWVAIRGGRLARPIYDTNGPILDLSRISKTVAIKVRGTLDSTEWALMIKCGSVAWCASS